MFKIKSTPLNGCYEIIPRITDDKRGRFVKTFHNIEFSKLGLETNFVEQYFSTSVKDTLRGLHFQNPPNDHAKLVYCLSGIVLDVVLDIRRWSPTYGKVYSVELNSNICNMIYMEKGFAHGFFVLSNNASLVYNVSTVYADKSDDGILWSSIDFKWPIVDPILSDRDSSFQKFSEYKSLFDTGIK